MSSRAAVVLMVWRIILTVGLLGCSSEARVTCKDNNDREVDWYVLYKAPAGVDTPNGAETTGLEYLYISSSDSPGTGMKHTETFQAINDPRGVLANTLRPLFTTPLPQDFGFISYNDQPPAGTASQNFGHSKGVLMVDRTSTGVWLLHSTPQFPFERDQNKFWPKSGKRNGQTFICVTFPYDQFSLIGKHLQYIGAFPFEHDVPDNFHQELTNAVNKVRLEPPKNFQPLGSSGNQAFLSIAKQQSENTKDGDLYVTIAELVGSDLDVQTWGCQFKHACSYCPLSGRKVINIKELRTGLGTWEPGSDHSKWCVAKNQNKHLTCVADMNRAPTQYARRGGALCIESETLKATFVNFIGISDGCTSQNIMDILNTECEPDSDMALVKRPKLASGSS